MVRILCVRVVWRGNVAGTPPGREVYDGVAVENIHSAEHLEGNQLCDRETSSRPRRGPASDADVAGKWPLARLSTIKEEKKERNRENVRSRMTTLSIHPNETPEEQKTRRQRDSEKDRRKLKRDSGERKQREREKE